MEINYKLDVNVKLTSSRNNGNWREYETTITSTKALFNNYESHANKVERWLTDLFVPAGQSVHLVNRFPELKDGVYTYVFKTTVDSSD